MSAWKLDKTHQFGASLTNNQVISSSVLPPHLFKSALWVPTSLNPHCLNIFTEVGLAGTQVLPPVLSAMALQWCVRNVPKPLLWKSGWTIVPFRSTQILETGIRAWRVSYDNQSGGHIRTAPQRSDTQWMFEALPCLYPQLLEACHVS